jgi:hypothetical protein
MKDVRRLAITDQDGSLAIVICPNGSRVLTLLVSAWTIVVLLFAGVLGYVLWRGRFPAEIWAFYTAGVILMVASGAYIIFWNVSFTKVIRFVGQTLVIEGNGVRRRNRVPLETISSFRLTRPWPYSASDLDYEFLGLGLWSVEARRRDRPTRLIAWVNRDTAMAVAKALCVKGFRVDVPFPLNGLAAQRGAMGESGTPPTPRS